MADTQTAETQTQSGTTAVSTGTTATSSESESLSPYDKIVKEYFSEVMGDTETSTATTQPEGSNVERAFQALSSELSAIKQQLAVAGTKPETVSKETKDEFLDLYARGDKEGARQALIKEMAPQIKAELSKSVSQDVIRATRAETDIRSYGDRLRSDNPDLVPFERAISLEARDLVQQAVQSGLVKTVEEYVSASKRALQVTVDAYKKRTLALKGEGKTEAQTRTQQVVASGAVKPGQTQTTSSDSSSQQPDISAESYLQRRREANRAGRQLN